MKRIYISGPMSGLPGLNFAAFNAEAARLRALGFEVVNPAEINPQAPTDSASAPSSSGANQTASASIVAWQGFLRADLRELLTCDTVAYLPGWEDSNGAQLEIHVASRVGIGVIEAQKVNWPCGSLD